MNFSELIAMSLYLALVVGVGIYFFIKGRKSNGGEKDYFLGGRNMNGWVAALSAGASDMSAWVLMGLPGSIFLYGMGQVWISAGLFVGTVCSWIFIAPRLRRYSIRANDSITIPQFLTNRFKSNNKALQIVSAIVFVIVYCIYSASSIDACGTLFNTVVGMDKGLAMIIATCVIVVYTFLGGFNAVCWTDFFQGLLMLGALMLAPIIAVFAINPADFVAPANFYNVLESGKADWTSISTILSGLGWGLGYFGMPHIIVRYISIKSEKEMKKSRIIGSVWTGIILTMATIVGLVGRKYLGDNANIASNNNLVFIEMVRAVFPAFIGGILLSAILAASMSTADSQLLASSSAFASDVYKPVFRKNASNKEMLWAGRIIVILIAIVAFIIAKNPNSGGIMALVECAWAGFGSAFGPVIILALYWKRLTYSGAVSGICIGFIVDAIWYYFLSSSTGLYEIIPGFICGLIAAVVVSLVSNSPSQEVIDLFEESKKPID
ncbi:MAG: sodium/proline symporter PutP [Clostridia bacterium]|nr:sodium/proline symporter PutP [Clostridia bacterium]